MLIRPACSASRRKEQWLRRNPQELRSSEITDDMVVCERHF